MVDLVETLKAAATFAGPILGGGGVWAFMSARQTAKTAAPASIATSQADLVAALTAQTKTLLAESAKDRRDLKRRIDRQGVKLSALSVDVADCHTRHAECEASLSQVRLEIASVAREAGAITHTDTHIETTRIEATKTNVPD